MNVLLIESGWSPEREVSLSDAKQIHNTLPGMTSGSLIPKEAAVMGLSFGTMLEHLILFVMKKQTPCS